MTATNSDQLALLVAILANPEDDTIRLVYADFLEENGDGARAEFIRTQIELARLGPPHVVVDEKPNLTKHGPNYWSIGLWVFADGGHPLCMIPLRAGDRVDVPKRNNPLYGLRVSKVEGDRAVLVFDERSKPWVGDALRRRERELWSVSLGWAWPFNGALDWFRRGFVERVECSAADFLRHADATCWHPGQTVACEGCRNGATCRQTWNDGKIVTGRFVPATRRFTECPDCRGTGRIPRRCPAHAQPIREVTLTSRPNYFFETETRGEYVDTDELWSLGECQFKDAAARRWNGITFSCAPGVFPHEPPIDG